MLPLLVAVQELQQQEAALAVQVSHLTLQNLELRRELNSGWMLAEPNILQVNTASPNYLCCACSHITVYNLWQLW